MKRYWLKYKKLIVVSIILILLSSIAQVLFDIAIGKLLDKALLSLADEFRWLSIGLVLLVTIRAFSFYRYTREYKMFSVNSISDMRNGIFQTLLKSNYPSFLKRKAGNIVSMYTNHLDTIEGGYFFSFYGSFQIIASIITTIIAMVYINWKFALLATVLLIPPVFAPRLLKKRLSDAIKNRMTSLEINTGKFSQWMDSIDVIHNYQATERFIQKFGEDTKDIQKKSEKYNHLAYLSHSSSILLSQIGLVIIISYLSYCVFKGELSVGMFMAGVSMVDELLSHVIYQAGYMQQIMSTKVLTAEVLETIDSEEVLPENKLLAPVDSIVYKDLNFGYTKNRNIIKDFNLNIHDRGIYLFTGESGCGKSTLMNLLAGYYKPVSGRVSLNGQATTEMENIPEKITIMRQEAVFFNDTLRNNLTMHQHVDDEEIISLLKSLGLNKYANKESLDSVLTSEGDNFSGGEARRFMLVRSLMKPSDILILDEPLANVDEESINKIMELIFKIKDKFIFIISHQVPEGLARKAIQTIKM